jgi:Tol biopolymer transport system component
LALAATALVACDDGLGPPPSEPAGRISASSAPPPGDSPLPTFTPQQLAFVSDFESQGDIYLLNGNGGGLTRLTFTSALKKDLAWSPDGTRLAFVQSGRIHAVDANGANLVNLSNGFTTDSGPTWSPNGSKILFQRKVTVNTGQFTLTDWEVYVMNADGTGQTNLSQYGLAYDGDPRWSPDGSQIVFTSRRDGNLEIYRMNADGTGKVNLSNHPEEDRWPDWSVQGKITFTRGPAYMWPSRLYVMSSNGTGLQERTLPRGFTRADFPRWSPDGQRLLVLLDIDKFWGFDSDGLYAHQVLVDGGTTATFQPAGWSSGGSRVAAAMVTGPTYCQPGAINIKIGDTGGSWTKNLTCGCRGIVIGRRNSPGAPGPRWSMSPSVSAW